MCKLRFSLTICLVLIGCGDAKPRSTGSRGVSERIRDAGMENGKTPSGSDEKSGERQSTIRIGDSLLATIENLRHLQISVEETPQDIAWDDGKEHHLYCVSRSRKPTDLLYIVAIPKADSTDFEIESIYWEVDFIKQNVAKGERPDPIQEDVDDVKISDLVSELAKE